MTGLQTRRRRLAAYAPFTAKSRTAVEVSTLSIFSDPLIFINKRLGARLYDRTCLSEVFFSGNFWPAWRCHCKQCPTALAVGVGNIHCQTLPIARRNWWYDLSWA